MKGGMVAKEEKFRDAHVVQAASREDLQTSELRKTRDIVDFYNTTYYLRTRAFGFNRYRRQNLIWRL